MASTSPETQPSCRLLSLAAELRNEIYELVFDEQSEEPTELSSVKPPSKALLLACHAINTEATLIYKHAYRRFWTETSFTLNDPCKPSKSIIDTVSAIRDQDCDHIVRMRITRYKGGYGFRTWTYLGEGFWRKEYHHSRENRAGHRILPDVRSNLAALKKRMADDLVQHAPMKKMLQEYICIWPESYGTEQ
ncbi:hypothetical protein LTR22_024881 [Elasticomyces elasticus]|nr:hypothetical protein LTR22_024881 [Elasticomyces elasticus]KAK5758403.1 hypothetical protein LTS12_011425 [Elasticomyces elasticus]